MDEEVFLEALYEAVHAVGCSPEDRETLVRYLQEVVFPDNNASVLVQVKEKQGPRVCLKVNVVEARDLKPTDSNGLSDPFCALSVGSSPDQKKLTCYKTKTLNPTWNETFLLPLGDPTQDILYVEVWDFDPKESTREKMKKIAEVKGMKGMKMLMKEVMPLNKQQNDFVGISRVVLKRVPANGLSLWCDIEKEGKMKRQGELRLQLSYVFDSNFEVPYGKLVKRVVQHELHNIKVNGKLSSSADMLLEQHRVQHNMEPHSDVIVRWNEMVDIHLECPLNVGLFVPMVAKLILCLRDDILNNEQQTIFLEAGEKLLRACIFDIRKLTMNITEPSADTHVSDLISIISQLAAVNGLEETKNIYNEMILAITDGISEWFTNIVEKYNLEDNEIKINNLILITDHVTLFWKAAGEYDDLFQKHLQMLYSDIVFKILAKKMLELMQPIIVPLCQSLPTSRLPVHSPTELDENMTSLFQLYITLRKLFGSALNKYGRDPELLLLQEPLQQWFYSGAIHWIIVSFHKSYHAIRKAVNLDRLERVDENSDITGSVLDVLHIFQQVKVFWEKLDWPDAEMAFVFVVNIINDICDCTLLYIEELCEKAETQRSRNGEPYTVTKELCFAANNILYLQKQLPQTIRELRAEEAASRLASNYSTEISQRTLTLISHNVTEIMSNKQGELFNRTAKKISTELMKTLEQSSNEDVILRYLDSNLHTLHDHLHPENFTDILGYVWKNVLSSFHEHIRTAVKTSKDVTYFKSCLKILKDTVAYFKSLDGNVDLQLAANLEELLVLNGMNTSELIHQYYKNQHVHQKTEILSECGLLTARLQFDDDTLRIEILNARDIHFVVNGSTCDPYVRISLHPSHAFPDQSTWVTKVHKKTVYPLFDEVFEMKLSVHQRYVVDGLVVFELKDKHYVGADKLLGEAFVPFTQIPKTDTKLEYLEQIHLQLSYPSSLDNDTFAVLANRQDKDAKEFVKRRRKLVQSLKTVITDK